MHRLDHLAQAMTPSMLVQDLINMHNSLSIWRDSRTSYNPDRQSHDTSFAVSRRVATSVRLVNNATQPLSAVKESWPGSLLHAESCLESAHLSSMIWKRDASDWLESAPLVLASVFLRLAKSQLINGGAYGANCVEKFMRLVPSRG